MESDCSTQIQCYKFCIFYFSRASVAQTVNATDSSTIDRGFESHQCLYTCRSMWIKEDAMLALKPGADIKTGVSATPQKGFLSSKRDFLKPAHTYGTWKNYACKPQMRTHNLSESRISGCCTYTL